MNINTRKESKKDYDSITEVIKSAFWRTGKEESFNEWTLVDKIRNSECYINDLSLVAEVDDKICGHIMVTPLNIRNMNNTFQSLAIAPVSVSKEYQKKAIGKKLMESVIEHSKKLGYKSIVVLGDPNYYTKFGFKKAIDYDIKLNDDLKEYLFALELKEGGLKGVNGIIEYCSAFYNEVGELI